MNFPFASAILPLSTPTTNKDDVLWYTTGLAYVVKPALLVILTFSIGNFGNSSISMRSVSYIQERNEWIRGEVNRPSRGSDPVSRTWFGNRKKHLMRLEFSFLRLLYHLHTNQEQRHWWTMWVCRLVQATVLVKGFRKNATPREKLERKHTRREKYT